MLQLRAGMSAGPSSVAHALQHVRYAQSSMYSSLSVVDQLVSFVRKDLKVAYVSAMASQHTLHAMLLSLSCLQAHAVSVSCPPACFCSHMVAYKEDLWQWCSLWPVAKSDHNPLQGLTAHVVPKA